MIDTRRLASAGAAHMAGMILLVAWWLALGLALPVSEAATRFEAMILHPNWVPVNLVGLAACLVLVLSLPVLFFGGPKRPGALGFAGLVIAETGLVLFTSIQYYETFLWPVVARTAPELVGSGGLLIFGDLLVLVPLVVSGLCLGIGYLLLGVALWRARAVPSIAVILLIIGAVLFGNGIAFPVRTLGLLIYAGATIACCLALIQAARAVSA